MVWAVILAAGESRRMGTPKLLLPFGEGTIIQTIVSKVFAAGVSRILVVLGGEADRVRAALEGYPVEFTDNPDFRSGMLSSVQRGMGALPDDATAALIVLADQPMISVKAIRSILEAGRASTKGLVVPVFLGKRGHPLLMSLAYRREVQGLDRGIGLRQLLAKHPEDVLEVEMPDAALVEDIDTPADYLRARPAGKGKDS